MLRRSGSDILLCKRTDFSILMDIPEAEQNVSKMTSKAAHSWIDPVPITITSSTKSKCVNARVGDIWIPLIRPLFQASAMRRLSPFMIKIKRRGERGQPWRIPQEAEKKSEGIPLISTAKVAEVRQPIIHLTVWRGTPIWIKIRRINVQLTLSKAFIKSILSRKAHRLFVLIEWRDSYTIPIGSIIWRFLRNPYCC